MRDDFGDSSRVAIAAFPSFSCSLTSGSLSLRRSCRGDEGKLALGPRVEEAELGVGWSLEDGGGVGGGRWEAGVAVGRKRRYSAASAATAEQPEGGRGFAGWVGGWACEMGAPESRAGLRERG